MILHHADGLALRGQAKHQLDEIAARGGEAARPEDAGRADDQRGIEIGARVQFAREFRDGVSSQRMSLIVFAIGAAGQPVEYVVGGKMHQPGVALPARHGNVAHRERVHQESGLRLFFGDVHLVVSRGVDHHAGIDAREGALHLPRIGDVHRGALESDGVVTARGEHAQQFDAELPAASKNRYPFRHVFIMLCTSRRHERRNKGRDSSAGF